MPHDIVNGHVGHIGHNHPHDSDHLHSHMPDADRAEELKVLTTQFIEGFVDAKDKMSYLRIAGVPLEIADSEGGPNLKLVDVTLTTEWQVGTASPSFGSQELSYLPYPGPMITERTNMGLVYVSLRVKHVEDLRNFMKNHKAAGADAS
ncbi:hypothetical protein [Anianabacter salinae]|uniref:hypothetical protein n=1 Tax=Anianabacter salinae TaxID=2851023 RepID=UPI00225DD679|nr:hypothetical protein [Anianabacter salinae]MBV0914036.1 hypothetical protein [Anianabacter salinae]